MKFCTTTLGCKVNQYDTGIIETILLDKGHEHVKLGEGCDVCILNTCAVTEQSVRKSRQALQRMKKLEPAALYVMCGCFSELDPETAEKIGADLTGGTKDREDFALKIEDLVLTKQGSTTFFREEKKTKSSPCLASPRTRALLKIQDGCNNFCTYCIIPYARGPSRSLPLEQIIEKAKKLATQGYKETVITGIEISSYGKDSARQGDGSLVLSPHPLITAVRSVNTVAPEIRIRLGSLDPALITPKFTEDLSKIPNICNHFHLSLQSGCDDVLKRMGRKYTAAQVQQAINTLKKAFENCAITADLIVGFPGETQAEFDETHKFIKQAGFAKVHIFPYSKRPGTLAANMPDQIKKNTKTQRTRIITEAAKKSEIKFKQSQIGKTLEVLFEQHKNGISKGHTSNYLQVAVNEKIPKNTIHKVKLADIKNDVLTGKIV